MWSKNSNFKAKDVVQGVLRGAGISSTGILALLGIIAISPITNKVDAANGWDEGLKNYRETASTVTLSMDSGTNSVVNAGNTNTNVGVVKRTASVTLGNTNGYSVYIRANSANLTGSNSSNIIPSVTSNSTLSQMTDKWGWNGSVGDSVTDCSLSDVFKQMTTSNQTLGSGGAVSSGTKKVTMCFGTRVSEAKVADTYSNTVTLSVVAQPGQTAAFGGITNMQQMTASICSAAPYHETAQLTDTRDNKKYWVTKMLDGNCWMSQNLDFDISTTNVTTATSDVTSNWTSSSLYSPQITSIDLETGAFSDSTDNHANDTFSWNLGEYVISDPTDATLCGGGEYQSGGLAKCDRFIEIGSREVSADPNFYQKNGATYNATEYDAHYLAGNYYQWNAATAGTGAGVTYANAVGSICPKGWKLPSSATSDTTITKGTYAYLLSQYGLISAWNMGSLTGVSSVNSNTYDLTKSPLFFSRNGGIYPGRYLVDAGRRGQYWSSWASTATSTYRLVFLDNIIYPSANDNRYEGRSLRCLIPTT